MCQALSVEQSLVGRGEGRSPRAENEARVDGRETGEEIGVQRRRFVLIYLLFLWLSVKIPDPPFF